VEKLLTAQENLVLQELNTKKNNFAFCQKELEEAKKSLFGVDLEDFELLCKTGEELVKLKKRLKSLDKQHKQEKLETKVEIPPK
jgi:hypothetical protein